MKEKKKTWALVGAVSAVVCLILGLVSGNVPLDNRSKLIEITKPGDANHTYIQGKEPTLEQRKAGKRAMLQWRKADKRTKNRIVSDLLLGNTLIGMNQERVIEYLGKPDGFGSPHEIHQEMSVIGYNVACDESQCDLRLELEDKRVERAILDVNY